MTKREREEEFEAMGALFKSALPEFQEVAKKYGFDISLRYTGISWMYFPQVSSSWKPPVQEDNND